MSARDVTIFILAGGLSTRMGRDKSRLRLDGKTLVRFIRDRVASLGAPVRVIRRDAVPRCGPLGGIFTGLKRCRTARAIFLSCDMPMVDARLLRKLLRAAGDAPLACCRCGRVVEPFPLIAKSEMVGEVKARIGRGELAVHRLPARRVAVRRTEHRRWFANVNTPADFATTKALPIVLCAQKKCASSRV